MTTAGPDEPFFRERSAAPDGQRSLARAAAFGRALGLDFEQLPPALVVVGSKGKGTASTYAAAALSAAGLRVGLLTSPGLRSHRERIRIDGAALTPEEYSELSARIRDGLDRGEALPHDGYLSPTGLYTLAGLLRFTDASCDVVVLEAGMGGGGDEVSLVPALGVIVTPIFAEHLGRLGATVEAIAVEKLAVISAYTEAVTAVTQPASVAALTSARAGPRLRIVDAVDAAAIGGLPGEPVGANAVAGIVAAQRLLDALGAPPASQESNDRLLRSINLPGRLSVHTVGDQRWGVDSAIDGGGAEAALSWFQQQLGMPTAIVAAIPDGKDQDGVVGAVGNRPLIRVTVDTAHLTFEQWRPARRFEDMDIAGLGERPVALGCVSFVGAVLQRLGVDTAKAYGP